MLFVFASTLLLVPFASVSALTHTQSNHPNTLHDITPAAETITVTSTDDPNTALNETCVTDSPCTLRRAFVQARNSSNKPVTIEFNLPTTDAGYDSTNQVWVFEFSGIGSELRDPQGQTIVDGTTQSSRPGARASTAGPSVFIRGTPTSNQFDQIVFSGDSNELRGVGLQYASVQFNGSNNVIEDNWLGLTLDGTAIQFPLDDPERNNRAFISTAETPLADDGNNLIQNNTLAGSRTGAIELRSDNSTVTGNQVGTRADGTLPDVPANVQCSPTAQIPSNWFGGDGINVSGSDNMVTDNVIMGLLFASNDPNSTQAPAIEVSLSDNTVQDNLIGMQRDGTKRWICGLGIRLTDEGHNVLNNQIYGARGEGAIAIFGTAATLGSGGITLQGNIVEESSPAIFFGPTVPGRYANFNPAQITSISGTSVSGTNGPDGIIPPSTTFPSTCNGCTIEVYADDADSNVETLELLGSTTSSSTDGTWSLTLSRELASGEGLRTISTTSEFDQIQNLVAGTSTGVSELYIANNVVYVPLVEN
jgi:hypothetical protein